MSGNYMMYPWSTEFWQQFLSNPVNGVVDQEILPSWFSTNIKVTGLGDPELERQIVTEVATYGKQIGELTDVVLALAESANLTDNRALNELRTIAQQIELTKQVHRESAQQRAEHALQELAASDPEGLSRLIASFQTSCVMNES